MTTQKDLFGEDRQVVQIKDNAVLEKACNRLLDMIKHKPELLDGSTMSEIDHRLFAELVWEDCFKSLISEDKKEIFISAMMRAPQWDVFSRARRELLSRDLIRVSSRAVQDAERTRKRIAGAMR
jgi:hypothetical protein